MKLPTFTHSIQFRRALKIVGGVIALVIALNMGWVKPTQRHRGIAESKATGLGAVTEYPGSQQEYSQGGMVAPAALYLEPPRPPLARMSSGPDRKVMRTLTFGLAVATPHETVAVIRRLTEQAGGYLTKSETRGQDSFETASLELQVPAARMDDVRVQLRKLAQQVTSEEERAQDVTTQYVDTDAALRNLVVSEAQYLQILRRATTVKDVMEVTEKLNEVRGEIEKTQSEFKALALQTEMCLISVSLQKKQERNMLGIEWHPGWEIKWGLRSGIESLASYVNSILFFAFHLPSILLWTFTIIVGAAIAWKVLKGALRLVFGFVS